MLIRHSNDSYSWNETGKIYYGYKAKSKALIAGLAELGIHKFKFKARSSGVSYYEIEMAIAEFRAKGSDILRDDTRSGDDELDANNNGTTDINGTVANSE